MRNSKSVGEILATGVSFDYRVAVAIVQELIASLSRPVEISPPVAPPWLDNVRLANDGSVSCRSCPPPPDVIDVARLLQAMLPSEPGLRVPGSLRYATARALREVDAPPFASIAEFGATLARYESGDRRALLRELYARAAGGPQTGPVRVERRRAGASSAELRRQLREADERAFELITAERRRESESVELPPRAVRWRRAPAAAGAVLIAFGGGYAAIRHPQRDQPPASPSAVTAAADIALAAERTVPARLDLPAASARSIPRPAAPHRDAIAPAFATTATAMFAGQGTDDDLRLMSITGDGARNYHLQPSPDGARIAFDSDRDGERGVYVADGDGSHVTRVSGAGFAAMPTWAPDGRRLALIRAERDRPDVWNLWLLSLENNAMEPLTTLSRGRTSEASWFADGRRISYTIGDRLVVLDLATRGAVTFPSPVAGRALSAPTVSPDGHFVMLHVAGSGGWLLDLRDGTSICALADPTVAGFSWSADSSRVAFHSRRHDEWAIWRRAATIG